ncbi:unnamed protein product [Rotaria sp. Silwood1]|nr:unnamed protein product [Rotaria sp. Silwood1]CAF1545096.1 unnamed protein product [Rotaria sp. Silwood1]CAF3697181.1 unnamed protein product [Rotaria sp. Silwood1]CAF3713195.1 unnamed protein product [Rotaria sp. Silwood1]CAF4749236.1 unnamed protein product [Rotaria sp. Silwood1]
MYGRCLNFIHHQASQLPQQRQRRRTQRDLMITRRILFTVIALTLPGIPNLTFALMTNINPRFSGSYYMYRIQFMGPTVTIFILSILIVFITPQIKQRIIKLKFPRSQVRPIASTMRQL